MRRVDVLWFAALAALSAMFPGCRGRDDLDGRRSPVAGLPERQATFFLADGDGDDDRASRVAYDVLDNRSSLGLVRDGQLVIDCGSPGFATFIEGGYRSTWHTAVDFHGHRAALTGGLAGELYLPLDRDPGGVLPAEPSGLHIGMYVRSTAPDQLVSVFFNEIRLRDVAMPTPEWAWYDVEVPAEAVRVGENKLRFYFRHTADANGVSSAAAFARIVVSAGDSPRAPTAGRALDVEPVARANGSLRGFEFDESTRLSAWLRVPESNPRLRFATSGGATRVAVRPAEGDWRSVWSRDASKDWSRAEVDLAEWAGRIVRLDLSGDGQVAWGRPQVVAASPRADAAPSPAPDCIVVWVVSSLRPDGGGAPTPAFDRVRREGVRFDGVVAASSSPGPAHVALLTGRHPVGDRPDERARVLGERLRAAGWQGGLFSGNGFVNDDLGFARGFATYENPMRSSQPHSSRVLWQMARRFLKRRIDKGQPRALVYIAASEPHLPYTPSSEAREREWSAPQPFEPAQTTTVAAAVASGRRRLTADERAYFRALYAAEVRDADEAFAGMLTDLEKLGIADRTLVVLMGDHGEELLERGAVGHGTSLREEVLRVPLALWMPGALAPGTVTATVGSVDVHAAILELIGAAPGPTTQGQSLLSLLGPRAPAPRPAFSHLPNVGRAVTLAGWRLVVPVARGHELYDLRSGADQEGNAMGQRPVIERYLRNAFGLHVAFERAWRVVRWGTADNVTDAFGIDQGL